MAAAERPLEGCVVLLTRPPERADALAARLRAWGARVEARPTIALEPPVDAEPARRAVAELDRYDWIVFTSANGVRFFHALWREIRGAPVRLAPAVAAIGPATARELERSGCIPDVVAEDSRSEGLVRSLAGRVEAGARVLVVRPEVARPLLPRALSELGARPEAIAFYRNAPAPEVAALVDEICEDRFDVVVLTSPSSLERLLEVGYGSAHGLVSALRRARLVSIGPVTARAIEHAGLEAAAVADAPTDAAVARSVRSLFD
jgi:uroporphyrinogen-III synthase